MVDWCQHTDHLCCSSSFHGTLCYDCVIIKTKNGHIFDWLLFVFQCLAVEKTTLILVHPYNVPTGPCTWKDRYLNFFQLHAQPCKLLEIFSVRSIIWGVALTEDYMQPGDYLVIDTINTDMFLQMQKLHQDAGHHGWVWRIWKLYPDTYGHYSLVPTHVPSPLPISRRLQCGLSTFLCHCSPFIRPQKQLHHPCQTPLLSYHLWKSLWLMARNTPNECHSLWTLFLVSSTKLNVCSDGFLTNIWPLLSTWLLLLQSRVSFSLAPLLQSSGWKSVA